MPFNRIPRISVSDLLPGAITGLWTIGDPAAAHVEIGTHPADASPTAGHSGIRLYGPDGHTVIVELDATGGYAGPDAGHAATADSATIAGKVTVGDPAHAHAVMGTDGAGASGFRLYDADGTTVLVDLNTDGVNKFAGEVLVGSLIHGADVSGAVATAATATNAGHATNADVAGLIVVGDPAHAHAVMGTDTHGADGFRLYGPDGTTVVVDLRADDGSALITGVYRSDANPTVNGGLVINAGAYDSKLSFYAGTAHVSSETPATLQATGGSIGLFAGHVGPAGGTPGSISLERATGAGQDGCAIIDSQIIRRGSTLGTTNGSGIITITHGLQLPSSGTYTPDGVTATFQGSQKRSVACTNFTATTFDAHVFDAAGDVTGVLCRINWQAWVNV